MRQKTFSHLPPHHTSRSRWIARLLVAMGFAFLYTFGLINAPATTHAAGVPGGNVTDPFVRAVDIARPAVVRIITTIGGHLTVDFGNGKLQTFPIGGGSYKLQLSGSGAFISSQGDILTADHVVHPPHDQSLDAYLDQVASNDVANYVNENFQVTQTYTAQYTALLLVDGYLPSHSSYDSPTSEVYMSTEYTGPLTTSTLDALPSSVHSTVDQIKQFSPFDQKDVAIVHVPRTDTPSILVGDSSNVEPQDELRVVGFPGNGDVSNTDAPNDFLTPSINQLFVSAINKKTDNNADVIQVGGNVEHGDSGGPALDSSGEIMGVVSFGLQQAGTPGTTTFLQVSNSARMLIITLGLDTKPGNFQTQWTRAFNDYSSTAAGHWHQASADLSALARHYTDFQAITPYLTYAQNQASHEQVPQKQPPTDYTWYIVGGVILLLVVLILVYVATRRRKQPLVASPTPVGMGMSPAPAFDQQQMPFGATPTPDAFKPALTPQLVPIGQADPNSGQMGQFGQGIPPSEEAMLNYRQVPPGSMQSGPDFPPFQPSGTPSQPIPYQPAQPAPSEPWTPYQGGGQPSPYQAPYQGGGQPSPYAPAQQPQPPYTPFDRPGAPANPGSPYQPATPSPYQPVGQGYAPPAAMRPNTGEIRPTYPPTPAPPVRPITGEVWPGMGAQQPFNATPGASPTPFQNPTPAANPSTVPPWLRQDIYARPQAPQSPQQPQVPQQPFGTPYQETPGSSETSDDQDKTVRSAGNVYGSNPGETEIRDRSGS